MCPYKMIGYCTYRRCKQSDEHSNIFETKVSEIGRVSEYWSVYIAGGDQTAHTDGLYITGGDQTAHTDGMYIAGGDQTAHTDGMYNILSFYITFWDFVWHFLHNL